MSWPSSPHRRGARWRPLAFLGLCAAGVAAYRGAGGEAAERMAIDVLTVRPVVALIDLWDPSLGVHAAGPRVAAPGGGLHVLPGCEGVDVIIMTVAAMAVAPLSWRLRAAGMVAGVLVLVVVNWLRVMTLFHIHRNGQAWFGLAHGLVLPLAMVAAAGLFFVAWVVWFAPRGR